ncbi:MAG TPA: hypothetical protein VIZ43_20010 [Trebonia sp.]
MTVFMSRRHAYQAKLRHHFPGRHSDLVATTLLGSPVSPDAPARYVA